MTRPKPITFNTNKLPDLTPAQKHRVRLFRENYRGSGKVRVIRKGQKPGHVLIIVRWRATDFYYWMDREGVIVDSARQEALPLGLSEPRNQPSSAIELNTEDE